MVARNVFVRVGRAFHAASSGCDHARAETTVAIFRVTGWGHFATVSTSVRIIIHSLPYTIDLITTWIPPVRWSVR